MATITTLEDANAELTLRLRQQEIAAEFAIFSLGADELQPILDAACSAASKGMACTLAKVLEHLPDEECFLMRAGVGWRPGRVGVTRLGCDLESPAGYAFQTGEPVLSNHLEDEMRFRTPAVLREHGVSSAFNVLIRTPDWRYGVLEADSTDRREFDDTDIVFLQGLAASLAQGIVKIRRMDELRRSRAFVQGVMEASPDCIKILSSEGRVSYMNQRGLEMNELGSLEDIEGIEFAAMWPDDERAAIRRAVARAVAGEIAEAQGFCPTATGKPRWWDLRFSPFDPGTDVPRQVVGVSRDVTARRNAEEALRALNETLEQRVADRARELLRSEARRQAYFDASPEYLCLMRRTAAGGIVYEDINPATERIYGMGRDAVLGRAPADIVDPEIAASMASRTAECLERGAAIHYEVERRLGGAGRRVVVDVVVIPIPGPQGDDGMVLFCGRDVTDQRRAEDALRQSQKMEAVGQLTGGLAHDFNNLLTGIVGSLEMLETRIAAGRLSGLERYMNAAQGAASRAAALTHRLLAFSRRQTLDPKPVEGGRLVTGLEELIRRTIGPEIELRVAVDAELWAVRCDPNQLENALLNLCINARDAMPDGGTLSLAAANVEIGARTAGLRDMPQGEHVALSVADTGSGMTQDVIDRAFDPFFTTKPLGAGTGLGLSMVHGFVHQSGGQVRIHSTEGVGTRIAIYLPRFRGEAAREAGALEIARTLRADAGETVLVVDDEPTIRLLLVDLLEDLGYAAIEAADGASGLGMLQSDRRIDLLVTDVGLPGGMNGRQMADAGRLRRPELKVLFITGYAAGASLGGGMLEPGMEIMTKPFAMEALGARIRTMIGGASGAARGAEARPDAPDRDASLQSDDGGNPPA